MMGLQTCTTKPDAEVGFVGKKLKKAEIITKKPLATLKCLFF
jgi:hypothetical protein